MLVSGILELDPDMIGTPNVYVHSYAEVWARRYHTLEFSVFFTYKEIFLREKQRIATLYSCFLRKTIV